VLEVCRRIEGRVEETLYESERRPVIVLCSAVR